MRPDGHVAAAFGADIPDERLEETMMIGLQMRGTARFLAAGVAVLGLSPAFAQTSASGQPAPGAAPNAQPAPRAAPNAQEVQARTEARISALHDQLHISAAEEPNWQAFTAVMKQNASEQAASLQARQQNFAGMNAVQDLQSFADLTRQQGEQIGKLVGPFQTLYAQFSPDQKATADRIFHNYTSHGPRARG